MRLIDKLCERLVKRLEEDHDGYRVEADYDPKKRVITYEVFTEYESCPADFWSPAEYDEHSIGTDVFDMRDLTLSEIRKALNDDDEFDVLADDLLSDIVGLYNRALDYSEEDAKADYYYELAIDKE